MELTDTQLKRLKDLDGEMERKRAYDSVHAARRNRQSIETGIPQNIIDMDVIGIGKILGLIKARRTIEGTEFGTASNRSPSLIQTLLRGVSAVGRNSSENTTGRFDRPTGIPPYFKHYPYCVTEDAKLARHKQTVQAVCAKFFTSVRDRIAQEVAIMESVIAVDSVQTIDEFVRFCKDNLTAIEHELEEMSAEQLSASSSTTSTATPSTSTSSDVVVEAEQIELLTQCRVLRRALLRFLPLNDYRALLHDQVRTVRKYVDFRTVQSPCGMSYLDKFLLLLHHHHHPRTCSTRSTRTGGGDAMENEDTSRCVEKIDMLRLRDALVVQSFSADPKLEPFDVEVVKARCCTPVVAVLPIEEILPFTLVGPFNNNPICYLPVSDVSFYLLKSVIAPCTSSSGHTHRLWVLDTALISTTRELRTDLLNFCTKLADQIKNPRSDGDTPPDIFTRMLRRNLTIITDKSKFTQLICKLIRVHSPIIATPYDHFNLFPF